MRNIFALLVCLLVTACATGPSVKGPEQLPIRRVVLYRNGVAYFERAGKFEGDELRFGVRQSEVGDFLSSLAAIERTPGGVQSVSFEAPEATPPSTPSKPPVANEESMSRDIQPATRDLQKSDPRNLVRLRFRNSGEHDVIVAYVVGAPIWRPTYRAVIDDKGALLQAWAVIQNISGEDWRDVSLSMTTGAPVAFRSDLGTPIVPDRPIVTDTGEVIASVPLSETALAQGDSATSAGPPPPAPSQVAPSEASESYATEEDAMKEEEAQSRDRSIASGAALKAARVVEKRRVSRAEPALKAVKKTYSGGISAQQAQQSVSSMAALAVLGEGVTRFDIEQPVTIPNGGSTMVAVLSQRVPGEQANLFAPDGGVPTSFNHPFRVIRLQNRTGAVLEKGPISVLGKGAFLGQGVLDTLPRDATAFVPFAVDRSVAVETSQGYSEAEGRLVRITRDQVVIERFFQRLTRYQVRNGGAEPVKVYVRHARIAGATLFEPPKDTEMTPGNALVPVTVAARGNAELKVDERTPVERTVEFISSLAADAVAVYLSGPAVDAAQSTALKKALEIRSQLLKAQDRLQNATAERDKLAQAAEETRDNLKSVRKIEGAADLRARLVKRLGELDIRMNELTRTTVETEMQLNELRVRLSEALQDVSLETKSP